MLAVISGLVFIIAGGFGIFAWKGEFFIVMKGLVPFMFVIGGVISVVAGVTSVAESIESRSADETAVEEKKEK